MRKSGILMPVFSLPSKYGIGTLGEEAYRFVDFLKKSGQSYWQILPLCPADLSNSPYQSFSSVAGNPFFIDLDFLRDDGLLLENEFKNTDFGTDECKVDYEKIKTERPKLLKKAFSRFDVNSEVFNSFCEENSDWLNDFALFMAIKDYFNGESFSQWDEKYKIHDKETLINFSNERKAEVDYYKFIQFQFYKQWEKLKNYANKNGIEIIGDMPIYVAYDSADVWAEPWQFLLDRNYCPEVVAGCPPDAFSATGQLWGMPVYAWERMKNDSVPYEWWCRRMRHMLKLYDVVRIDHFRGFESYYCIKYGEKTAENGEWRKGPGIEIFNVLKKIFGSDIKIIAEDLGFLTDDVKNLLKETGYPGMKVLQFAFDSREESDYLPHNYIKNCVVYTGTHDNDTVLGWTKTGNPDDVEYARRYLHVDENEGFNWAMIRSALSSVADTAIITMQDIIGLSCEGRINTPSTVGADNWSWRIMGGCINDWLAKIVYDNTFLYGRIRKN